VRRRCGRSVVPLICCALVIAVFTGCSASPTNSGASVQTSSGPVSTNANSRVLLDQSVPAPQLALAERVLSLAMKHDALGIANMLDPTNPKDPSISLEVEFLNQPGNFDQVVTVLTQTHAALTDSVVWPSFISEAAMAGKYGSSDLAAMGISSANAYNGIEVAIGTGATDQLLVTIHGVPSSTSTTSTTSSHPTTTPQSGSTGPWTLVDGSGTTFTLSMLHATLVSGMLTVVGLIKNTSNETESTGSFIGFSLLYKASPTSQPTQDDCLTITLGQKPDTCGLGGQSFYDGDPTKGGNPQVSPNDVIHNGLAPGASVWIDLRGTSVSDGVALSDIGISYFNHGQPQILIGSL
jgi:hypothetical protein